MFSLYMYHHSVGDLHEMRQRAYHIEFCTCVHLSAVKCHAFVTVRVSLRCCEEFNTESNILPCGIVQNVSLVYLSLHSFPSEHWCWWFIFGRQTEMTSVCVTVTGGQNAFGFVILRAVLPLTNSYKTDGWILMSDAGVLRDAGIVSLACMSLRRMRFRL